jgi:hypothetical protein
MLSESSCVVAVACDGTLVVCCCRGDMALSCVIAVARDGGDVVVARCCFVVMARCCGCVVFIVVTVSSSSLWHASCHVDMCLKI